MVTHCRLGLSKRDLLKDVSIDFRSVCLSFAFSTEILNFVFAAARSKTIDETRNGTGRTR